MKMVAEDDRLVLNGIDGSTGEYLVAPFSLEQAVSLITDKAVPDPLLRGPVAERLQRVAARAGQPHLGLPYDIDLEPPPVERAGWGIVFHADEADDVKEALRPLVEHRARHVAEGRWHVLAYEDNLGVGTWLARHKVGAGSVNPLRVPYYLLVVGDPQRIPFQFTQELDVEYAVGRLHFETVEEYRRYVESVIAYETATRIPTARDVVYFGTRHKGDRATQLSADALVARLAYGSPDEAGGLSSQLPVAEQEGFRSRTHIGSDATKETLRSILEGRDSPTPALLFTASHGMGWSDLGHPRQRADTGALLCQEWPGGVATPDHYFSAADISPEMQPAGLISIHYACFSGGTPQFDRFIHTPGKPPPQIAPMPFIAALPQALLAHPAGGALACITHVDRAWSCSHSPRGVGPQPIPFQNLIGRLLRGMPVGYVMKDINERYAVLSSRFGTKLVAASYGLEYPEKEMVTDWIERNDAEGYQVLGDPAVALRVNEML